MYNTTSYYRIVTILAFSFLVSSLNIIKAQVLESDTTSIKSISGYLTENNNLPIANRITLYHRVKKNVLNPNSIEDDMNMYGYRLLWDGKTEEALEIFKVIVADYPMSSNAYDSLAEAYQNLGEEKLSISNYQKSLELDPDNWNAADQIEKMKFPDKKQLTPHEKFTKVYTVAEYHNDLDQLKKTLLKVHPNALKFISKEAFTQLVNDKKSLINENTTYAEFAWHCREIVANINCSHTSTGGFYFENNMLPLNKRFPIQTRIVGDKMYVTDVLNNEKNIKVKEEIKSINGVEVTDIIDNIYRHIPSQGYIQTTQRHAFNRWSSGMIPFALGFPDTYKVTVADNTQPILLNTAEWHNDPVRDHTIAECGGDLCLQYIDKGKKIVMLTIRSFNYYYQNNFDVFKSFIDETIADIFANNTEHLIIDVRGNGGGSPESSMHLLKYLLDAPFIYYSKADFEGKQGVIEGEKPVIPFEKTYDGQSYFLIDGEGNSTTGHFMSIVKDKNIGTIIGEELGSNQFCSAGNKRCRLSNTKMEYYVAVNTHESSATSLPDEVGILPDHYVTQSIDEYLANIDVVKNYTLDLISKKVDWTSASGYHYTYFLSADPDLAKELLQLPVDFAPAMTFKGLEDLRFLKGWNKADSLTYWSYAFAWDVDQKTPLTKLDFETNLNLYFDGLMRLEQRSKEYNVPMTSSKFRKSKNVNGIIYYTGEIKTFDGFFEMKPLTFNVRAEQHYCPNIERTIVLFKFSPQDYDSRVWNDLDNIKIPNDICED